MHPVGDGFQIRFVPQGDSPEPFIANSAFLGPILYELGVHTTGPWEVMEDATGAAFQRAAVLG